MKYHDTVLIKDDFLKDYTKFLKESDQTEYFSDDVFVCPTGEF